MVRRSPRTAGAAGTTAGLDDLLESSSRIRSNIEQVIEGKPD
ncbi:MAG: hypothetical protein QOE99_2389, partial [Actinomycetota bacterium]|nr:hypothetical protein [Actinomycetota bacterium]